MKLSRRQFLHRGAAVACALGPSFLVRRANAARRSQRVLVAIFQRGAVDGLNMVVPHGDPAYHALRRAIAIPRPGSEVGAALDLDGFFGLHPALAPLLPAWQAGELAVVHACGSHDPTRSHFDAQDFMETGHPGDPSATDGWLNRHLQATSGGADDLRAVALTSAVPRILSGTATAYAATTLTELTLGATRDAELALAAIDGMYRDRDDLLGATVRDTLAHYDVFAEIGRLGARPANQAVYPEGNLGRQLREVARVLKADIGVEIAFLETGGWDTHVNQGGVTGALATLLAELAAALAAFRIDLGAAMADVCVLTMSEFGRTAAENGTRGTDHGHGTAMLVLGGTVQGGVHGLWPGLGPSELHEGRDLAITTDFRALFAEVLDRHLSNPEAGAVFPGFAYSAATRPGVIA
jgi:uncharacterized protein (DUF1501 family)